MSLRNLLKPAPYLEEIQDPSLIRKNYRYWRLRTFYAMYVGYVLYYFTRNSFVYAMPAMQSALGLSKVSLGFLCTIASIAYGMSKFVSGIVGDKSNPRYFMSIGLIVTGMLNLLFGMSSWLWAFAILWGLNGWFQGWGWPGCARLLTHWYSQTERGRWWTIWSTSHNLGGFLIPLLVTFCAEYFGWRYAMYVPGAICMFAGFWLMNRLRDTPQSLGLPSIEKFQGEQIGKGDTVERNTLSVREILFTYVLTNKFVWALGLFSFFLYVIRAMINNWSMMYLIEVKHYSHVTAGICVSLFEVGGFVGCLAGGWMSDVVFQGRRNPINVLFTLCILVVLAGFKWISFAWPILDAAFLFLFGFFIFGPQSIIGLATAELSHKKAAATASGFAGCFSYLGAAVAGAPLGFMLKTWGWDSFFLAVAGCSVIGALLIWPLWSVRSGIPAEQAQEPAAES